MKRFSVLLFGVFALLLSSCGPLDGGAPPSAEEGNSSASTTPPSTAAPDPFGPAPTTAPQPPSEGPQTPPDSAPPQTDDSGAQRALQATERLSSLSVVDDYSGQPEYNRDAFKHWSDPDGNRCDARQDVLIRQSIGGGAQVDPFDCTVVAGDWFSEYDGVTTETPGDFDVDHMVPLAEGWRSGAWAWDADKRERFANDLDSAQLIAVSASSNRSKSDKRPDQWMPPRAEYRCEYLFDWVEVKFVWQLSVATPEKNFISEQLRTC